MEWGAGEPGKDTARFAASGASLVARIVGPRDRVAEVWDGMRQRLAGAPAVLVEGAGALALAEERFTVLVAAAAMLGKRPERDQRLAAAADYIVAVGAPPEGEPASGPVAEAARRGVPVLAMSVGTPDLDLRPLVEAVRAFMGA